MTPAGTLITLLASCAWTTASAPGVVSITISPVKYLVVRSPLPLRGPVVAPGAVRKYRTPDGNWHEWRDTAIAGVRVQIPITGTPFPMLGTATNDGRVLLENGELRDWERLTGTSPGPSFARTGDREGNLSPTLP